MESVINILSDAVANRIAAGEVVQRPSSVVKELLENSIDAGATSIRLIVKEGGKGLIQVSDNGKGMNPADARLCFERHATSKIKDPDDLFRISTKGFRGEALATIAAVAKVELKTRTADSETGTRILMEDSDCVANEECAMQFGTVFSVRSLFYNVPARRKFLKSDSVELRHIIDEFFRVALAHPEIAFEFISNDQQQFKLPVSTLRQRIVGLFGSNNNEKLVPVGEETDIIKIYGFVVKPEFSRKTRGEQFFFVNNRFIKSPFLHHAVDSAFEGLLPKETFPGYFIFMECNPEDIDINIHPTKTEIKFTDERSIYQILRSSVRQALGRYNIAPSLDFDQETAFQASPPKDISEVKMPTIQVNRDFNPFSETQPRNTPDFRKDESFRIDLGQWEKQQTAVQDFTIGQIEPQVKTVQSRIGFADTETVSAPALFQLQNRFIVTSLRSGLVLIDQHRAHERIIYDRLALSVSSGQSITQQELFPQTLEMPPADFSIITEIFDDLLKLGFDMDLFGKNTIVVRGVPAVNAGNSLPELFEEIIEQYKNYSSDFSTSVQEKITRILAAKMSVKSGTKLTQPEMENIISELFQTANPYHTPSGKAIIVSFSGPDIDEKFNKSDTRR